MSRLTQCCFASIDLIVEVVICNSTRHTTTTTKECRRRIPSTSFNDLITSQLVETNSNRCSCCFRLSDVNLRRLCLRISSTEVGNVDISDFAVKNSSSSSCTCATDGYTVGIFSIINDIHRRSVGITSTTCQHLDVCNSTRRNSNVKHLSTDRLNNPCSRWGYIPSTSVSNNDLINLTVLVDSGDCLSIDTAFRCFIQINNGRIAVVETLLFNNNTINVYTTFTINRRLSNLTTARIDKRNSRDKVISTTRIHNSQTIDLTCCVIYSQSDFCQCATRRSAYKGDWRVV